MNHQFGEIQHTNSADDRPYVRCQRCGKVMFVSGDDYFNMECRVAAEDKERLREKLENKNGKLP